MTSPRERSITRERERRDRADARGEAVEPVEEVDHVHHGDDPDDRQRDPDRLRQVLHAEQREREAVHPDAEASTTIAAAATWPASFSHQRRPRKSSTAPTVVATAAPSRMPAHLAVELAGTRAPGRRSRGRARARRAGARRAVSSGGRPRRGRRRRAGGPCRRPRASAGRRSPRAIRAPQRTSRWLGELVPDHGRRLLRAVEAISRVAEAGDDVALLVQVRVDRGDEDVDVGMVALDARARPRARRSARSARCCAAPACLRIVDRVRRSSCRSRASGRAAARRARRCRRAA